MNASVTDPVPRVSVVMPVLNPDADYLGRAVDSILGQTFGDFELLVIEDPSSRSAAPVLAQRQDLRIRYIVNLERTSLVDQLNRGLAEARGELVARFDADDLCEPDRLEKQVAFLDVHPQIGVLGTQLAILDGEGRLCGRRDYPCDHDAIAGALARFNALAHPSVMFRKHLVVEAGGYNHRYLGNEDYELWCRLVARGVRLANLRAALVRYRIHPGALKSARLHSILRGTLEVKDTYWREQMNLRARARYLGERLLLWLPAAWVLRLFMWTHYRGAPAARDGAAARPVN